MTLLLSCLQGKAQGFFNLTAQEVRIDSVLPTFTYQKSLGSHYADSTYTVSIEYPEFIEMSKADIQRYRQLTDEVLPELPEITQYIGVSRKQGMLDVSFVPLVYRDGKYQKLVSFKLNVKSAPKMLARTRAEEEDTVETENGRYAEHSVLRSGTWAKIRIPDSQLWLL